MVGETTPLLSEEAPAAALDLGPVTPVRLAGKDDDGAASGVDVDAPPLSPNSWANSVSTPSGGHLIDTFPVDDTLPGDITPVDEPNLSGDDTPTKAARLKLVKVHRPGGEESEGGDPGWDSTLVLDADADEDGAEAEGGTGTLKRSGSAVTFSENLVEERSPPKAWGGGNEWPKSPKAGDAYKAESSARPVADPGAEGCGSPRRRGQPGAVKRIDYNKPQLLKGGIIDSLPGGRDDEDQSVCCVIS